MIDVAQTNLRLYAQLRAREAGDGGPWGAADLARAHAAYELAIRLFTGQFRGNGKSFLAHLVGTASIAARFGAGRDELLACLLHAAYTTGEFGNGVRGPSPAKRAVLRAHLGSEVEGVIMRYTMWPWSVGALERLATAGVSADDRVVLHMRLANELEDHVDDGARHCRESKYGAGTAQRRLVLGASIASAVGWGPMAEALTTAAAALDEPPPPAALVGVRKYSYLIAPASHRPRTGAGWRLPITGNPQWMRAWWQYALPMLRRLRG